ncbi:MAG: ABC transporter permease [Thermoleophilia bacterium]|nr:ABC transporter permease [Thermoleophilia bacterium]
MRAPRGPRDRGAWEAPVPGRVQKIARAIRRMPVTGLAGGAVLAVFVLAALLAPVIAPYDPNESDTLERLLSPNASHWFGTDQLGRDIFSRILWGGRYTLGASLAVVALSATIATTVAVVSGYFGGKVDLVIQRFVDGWIAFPAFVLLIALISLLGPSLRNVIVVLSFTMAGGMSRILRSSVIVVKEASYIEMARVVGADPVRIMFRHILPQIVPLVLILASVQMGGVVLVLASLGFLGFGIPPPTPEWGSMLSGRARDFIYSAYWLALFPGLAITLTVLCLNLFFDSVRDIIDPRMRGTGRR